MSRALRLDYGFFQFLHCSVLFKENLLVFFIKRKKYRDAVINFAEELNNVII